MNNKGQGFNFIQVIFVGIFFLIIFAIGLAPMVSSLLGGVDLSVLGSFGSWVAGNLNVWFFLAFIVGLLALLVWGFGSSE